MKSRVVTLIAAMTLLAGLAVPDRLAAQEPPKAKQRLHYGLTVLGTLGNPADSEAHGLNNRGSVSGQAFLPNSALHAFFWQMGVMTDLGTLGGPDSFVPVGNHTVNDSGVVAGYSETSEQDPNGENFCNPAFTNGLVCAAFASQHGVMTPLPTLGGTNGSAAGINNRGQIAGLAEGPNPDPCSPFALQVSAVVWRNGQVEQVLPPFGGSAATANAINDNGDAVGLSGCVTGNAYAVLWRRGKAINLGSLGGAFGNIPFDLNNKSQVVGQSDLPGDTIHHGFFWQNGVMTDLGNLPGLPTSLANGINNQGQIVGFSQDANGDDNTAVAVLWENGSIIDLNTVIPPGSPLFLMEAVAINDRGEIAGWGSLSNGDVLPFILTPCGEGGPEGCGQNLVETPKVTSSSTSSERPAIVLSSIKSMVLHRSDRWYRSGRSAVKATPPSQAEDPGKRSGFALPEEHMPLKGEQAEFETPRYFRRHGACEVNQSTGKLTGYCQGPQPPYHICAAGVSKQCPVGKHAIKPGFTQCGEGPPSYIDFARPCTF